MFNPYYWLAYGITVYGVPWGAIVLCSIFILRGKARSIALGLLSIPVWLVILLSVLVFLDWEEFKKTWWIFLSFLVIALLLTIKSISLWPRAARR